MKRSDIKPIPEYFDKYINLVKDIPLMEALQNSLSDVKDYDVNELKKIGNRTYAFDKWTINEIFQHLADVERILCYRALLIARNDQSVTPEFNEKFISDNSKANEKPLKDIIEQLIIERQSTIALFHSFDQEILLRTGRNWKYEMNVLGFGFCLVGHQIWHFKAIEEKYLNHLN